MAKSVLFSASAAKTEMTRHLQNPRIVWRGETGLSLTFLSFGMEGRYAPLHYPEATLYSFRYPT